MKLNRQNIPFTMVANEVLSRTDISWKAKGLYAYLFSKPSDWDFSADRIAREGKEARKMIQRTLLELEEVNLLKRVKLSSGRVEYDLLYAESQRSKTGLRLVEPKVQNGSESKGLGVKTDPISNTEEESNKEGESNIVNEQIVKVIDAFKEVNPLSYKKWFGNPVQRRASTKLIEVYGFGKVISVIAILPKTNKVPFLPVIDSPLKLSDKWTALESGLMKKKAELVGAGVSKKGFIM